MKRNNLNAIKLFIIGSMLIIGCVLIFIFISDQNQANKEQGELIGDIENLIGQQDPNDIQEQANPSENLGGGDSDTKAENIGILYIDKINVKMAIQSGTSDSVLRVAIGHFPSTPTPGSSGNVVITGHRGTRSGSYLFDLDQLTSGDIIKIKLMNGEEYTYQVDVTFVIESTDTWILSNSSADELTIITCTPVGSYDKRLVVKATPIS